MRTLNVITLLLLIVGGLNWGLVGLAEFDLVAALFGEMSGLSRFVYTLIGLSALWQVMPFIRSLSQGEVAAERDTHRHQVPRTR